MCCAAIQSPHLECGRPAALTRDQRQLQAKQAQPTCSGSGPQQLWNEGSEAWLARHDVEAAQFGGCMLEATRDCTLGHRSTGCQARLTP